ncbi:helix-turn-helix domain-containing protein [Gulosibacter bifidus]|uniref:Helix-turn-helix domain-containing protein n=1 Tax=Gulosibacter bifidus TaxID=272239 RepID=A0ABW5RL75_9MICO|nr:helix-turn-helix transcriptional regulator [Gulosibacter bifidus]
MVLVRHEMGEVLRDVRLRRGDTLRQVAGRASVALGYLSEIERGQKEVSSEILASVAEALDTPLSSIYFEVGNRLASHEQIAEREARLMGVIPDTVPDDLLERGGARKETSVSLR